MKKLLFAMVAFALCLGLNSCKKEAAATDDPANAEVKAADDAAAAPNLADIVAKAKEEGANWTVDQWKEQFKSVMLAIKPMMVAMSEINGKMEAAGEDAGKMAEIMKEVADVQAKYSDIEKQMDEFSKIAEGSENGKAVIDDEEWGKKMMEELGIPDVDI
ncbi:MAG: hypothetical protein J6Y97_04070 [Prevotella sp.]|nr:hypothetical protein [Prevotella sp.]